MTKEGVISEKTLLPIGFVIALLGGVAWLTNLHFEAQANSIAILDIQKKQDEYVLGQKEIIERLSRIEGKLGVGQKWTFRKGE